MSKKYEYTPENIESLKENEIFVFGSNLAGLHIGGAAYVAYTKFGAIYGQGTGMQGQSYAIPTLNKYFIRLLPHVIRKHLSRLFKFANTNHHLTFYITKIGCGIAGFTLEEISNIFKSFKKIPCNIILPKEFVDIIKNNNI